MNIIIITQDDVFYLGKYFNYLINKMPEWVNIRGIIILDFSPFGKPASLIKRILSSFEIFGIKFFLRYLTKYIYVILLNRKYLIRTVIKKYNIDEIKLINQNLNSLENINYLNKFKPDLIISISANQIFKKQFLNLPKDGCINLHTALLPKYKGLMPTFWALKNNESEIGVSVFFMNEGIDTGDILIQKIIAVKKSDTLETLINKTKREGMDALIDALNIIHSGDIKTFKPSGIGSYYTFPTRKDVKEFNNAGKGFY